MKRIAAQASRWRQTIRKKPSVNLVSDRIRVRGGVAKAMPPFSIVPAEQYGRGKTLLPNFFWSGAFLVDGEGKF